MDLGLEEQSEYFLPVAVIPGLVVVALEVRCTDMSTFTLPQTSKTPNSIDLILLNPFPSITFASLRPYLSLGQLISKPGLSEYQEVISM